MFQSGRLTMPPAGLAIKVFLAFVLFIFMVEVLTGGGHTGISEKLLPKPSQPNTPTIITHGTQRCLPRIDNGLTLQADNIRSSCREYSPFEPAHGRIGVATGQFGTPQEGYLKALSSHHMHSLVHGTELHVMCEAMIDDLWNKPAFLLSLLLDEMLKPETQRLEWIFWVDRDTIILDQCRPISSFLPPALKSEDLRDGDHMHHPPDVQMMISNDMNGLNNGIFLMRVSHWSINLLLDILAFRDFKPEVELRFTEQSAMENVLKEPKFAGNVQYVPQHWFNAYPQSTPKDFKERENTDNLDEYHVRRGDFLVHFAGRGEKGKEIKSWIDMLKKSDTVWKGGKILRDVDKEIESWWTRLGFRPTDTEDR